MSVDALRSRSDQLEKSLSPVFNQMLNASGLADLLPESVQALFSVLSNPPQPDWDDLMKVTMTLMTRVTSLAFGEEISRPFEYEARARMLTMLMTPDDVSVLRQRRKISDDVFYDRMHRGGYSDVEADYYYQVRKPYPAIPDIISYSRYFDEPTNPKKFAWQHYDINPDEWDMWNWLSYQKLNTEQVSTLSKRRFWTPERCNLEWARLGWQDEERTALLDLQYTIPNAMLLVQGGLMLGGNREDIYADISKADIHPIFVDKYYNAILTKPSTTDIIEYQLRTDPTLNQLEAELKRTGVHPDYFELYKTLAYPIPPIQDIITMAVREAFTPAIAQRFGQYEDLPPAFIEHAQHKGLTREWAERYWAAHWNLPSITQGFEMLHRGIISNDELQLLLRALDVMPFWRNKLIQMSYNPLTRVDVRRMFGLGVLDESGVLKAYKDLGYNDDNAKRMQDFTIRQTRQTLSKFTPTNVISAYTNRLIDSGQARSLLREIVGSDKEVNYILQSADNKREWTEKEERTKAIANLYKKGLRNEAQTIADLHAIGLPTDHITNLIDQWRLKAEADRTATWTSAQTLTFYKKGYITRERAIQELVLLGYNDERIATYILSATTTS
jgi:hypothetical protein